MTSETMVCEEALILGSHEFMMIMCNHFSLQAGMEQGHMLLFYPQVYFHLNFPFLFSCQCETFICVCSTWVTNRLFAFYIMLVYLLYLLCVFYDGVIILYPIIWSNICYTWLFDMNTIPVSCSAIPHLS
jgi:hypothetical protein